MNEKCNHIIGLYYGNEFDRDDWDLVFINQKIKRIDLKFNYCPICGEKINED